LRIHLYRFGKNLRAFYVVHSTFWLKIVETFISTFTEDNFWSKVKYVDQLREVYNFISQDQIIIPNEILEYFFFPFSIISFLSTSKNL
jgi:hypothetical protein